MPEDQKVDYSELIKEAYAATLDPSRLEAFERFWEAYIDSELQNRPKGFDFNTLEVNAHIKTALQILNRVKLLAENESAAQHLVDSHYGFSFIVESTGRIVVANDDAVKFVDRKAHLKEYEIDQESCDTIIRWMNESDKFDKNMCSFFHVFLKRDEKKTCWFLSPIELASYEGEIAKRHFLITSVELKVQVHSYEATGIMFGLTEAEANIHAWDGVIFPSTWIKKKPEPREAFTWRNTEQRRIACELVGWENIFKEMNAKVVHKDKDSEIGELISVKDWLNEHPELFLRVRCGTGRSFALPVPPNMKTAREANAWTWGLQPNEYKPEVRT